MNHHVFLCSLDEADDALKELTDYPLDARIPDDSCFAFSPSHALESPLRDLYPTDSNFWLTNFLSDKSYVSPILHLSSRINSPFFSSSCFASPLSPLTPSPKPKPRLKLRLSNKPLKRNHQNDTNRNDKILKRQKRTLRSSSTLFMYPRTPSPAPKLRHTSVLPSLLSQTTCNPIFSTREFSNVLESRKPTINPAYPLFYRRFPASSCIQIPSTTLDSIEPEFLFSITQHPGGTYNHPRWPLDLYTPRFVKGKGHDKVGLCPICMEPPSRGGEGRRVWLAMKFSAFKCYHMQYAHGISASTGRPYAPPLAFRTTARLNPAKHERTHMQEGLCHKCAKWVPIQGVKDVVTKVKEIYWWKHAALCHHGSSDTDEDEDDIYEPDAVYAAVKALPRIHS